MTIGLLLRYKALIPVVNSLKHTLRQQSTATVDGMELGELMQRLNGYAKRSLAAGWDNVGLLVEPSAPHQVKHVLLTNDLTTPVLEEALSLNTNMIFSYHPPIFKPMKRLSQGSWKERLIVKCVENKIAVYSPHTILDAMNDGVTDWLISPFVGVVRPVTCHMKDEQCHQVALVVPEMSADLLSSISDLKDSVSQQTFTKLQHNGSEEATEIKLLCRSSALNAVLAMLSKYSTPDRTVQVLQQSKVPQLDCGDGRIVNLTNPITLGEAVNICKSHLKLDKLRLARAVGKSLDSRVKTVAVCAGSGASVLSSVTADLYITGEMSHHELLDACHQGRSVILAEHSNTERGFLSLLATRLRKLFDDRIVVEVSSVDRDPVEIV